MKKIVASVPDRPPYYVSMIQVMAGGVEICWTTNPERAIKVSPQAAQVLAPYIYRSYREVIENG